MGDVLPAVRERLLPQLDHTLQCWRDLAAEEEAAPGPTPAAQAVPAAAEPIISVAVGSSAVGTIPGASAAVAAVAAVATAVAIASDDGGDDDAVDMGGPTGGGPAGGSGQARASPQDGKASRAGGGKRSGRARHPSIGPDELEAMPPRVRQCRAAARAGVPPK